MLGHQWWGGKKGVRVFRSRGSDAFSWLLASVLVASFSRFWVLEFTGFFCENEAILPVLLLMHCRS